MFCTCMLPVANGIRWDNDRQGPLAVLPLTSDIEARSAEGNISVTASNFTTKDSFGYHGYTNGK